MKHFIKAKDESGETVFVNLYLVGTIRETDAGYRLSMFGNFFYVDKDSEDIKAIAQI